MTVKDKNELTPEQYRVCWQRGTEAPFTGAFLHHNELGLYTCLCCGNPLFDSDTKFDAGCGWPSFSQSIEGSIRYLEDDSHGMHRTEVRCARCDSHLGHVFPDGPAPTGDRYCINSVALEFDPKA